MEEARAAVLADVPRLVELALALRAELTPMRGGALWSARESRAATDAAAFTALVERDDAELVVGTIDGVVIGYGTMEYETLRDGHTLGLFGDIYVEDDARAVGVGELIAEQLVAAAVAAGCHGIDAFALPGHREAKNFFERNGFTARALIMHKPLTRE
jgi:GNAT superfamily N-acetyltransferase